MKKVISIILSTVMMLTISASVFAANGDIVGHIYSTDIRAYINGVEVESYNIGGKTAVVIEDILNEKAHPYVYNDNSRTLKFFSLTPNIRKLKLSFSLASVFTTNNLFSYSLINLPFINPLAKTVPHNTTSASTIDIITVFLLNFTLFLIIVRITKPEERNIVPDAHESIVSDEIYEMAQKKLEKNKHGPRSEKRNIPYIFNNLYCGCCGTKLSKQYRLDRKENVDLIFYSCPSDSRGKQTHCIFKKINEEELCEVVYESLHLYICMAVRNKKVYLNKKTKVLKEYEEDISRYTHIIENIEVMRTKLFDDFGADKINGREYNTLVSNYEEKQEHYSKLLENLKIEKEKYLDEIIDRQNWINRLLKYEKSDHLTREMVDIFIERINLFSATKIEICYKFSDIFEDVMSNGGVYIG